jgi:hypothetical protein
MARTNAIRLPLWATQSLQTLPEPGTPTQGPPQGERFRVGWLVRRQGGEPFGSSRRPRGVGLT